MTNTKHTNAKSRDARQSTTTQITTNLAGKSHHQNTQAASDCNANHEPLYVTATVVARKLSVTHRYILQMAGAGRIPCIRLGQKCVRFDLAEVSAALGVNLIGGKGALAQP